MQKTFLALAAAALLAGSALSQPANPFAQASTLPYQAPPFDRIEDSDYQPAIEEGQRQALAEVKASADDSAAPTFDNVIVAMERKGAMLARAELAFGAVTQANTNPTLQAAQAALAPKQAAFNDAIYLDGKLFARVKALHDGQASLHLTPEQAMLLQTYWNNFVRAGAQLSAADQATLRDLNKQLATLSNTFKVKLLANTKAGALVVDDKAQLAGLSDAEIAAAARSAAERGTPGKFVLPLQNTTTQPALGSLTDRATRKALFDQSWTRAEKGDANDTRDTVAQIALLRAQKAKLLGFPTWADYSLGEQMAKTSGTAIGFMNNLDAATRAAQNREVAEVQKAIDASGTSFPVQPWDWDLYAEKVRKAKYDLDENQTKPYLEIWKVLEDGVFYAANQMYGLTFKRRTDLPVYQADVRTYEVFDADGKPLGLFYCDYWKRDNKSGGAWMSNFVRQSKLMGTRPVIYNVANFTKPADGQPALITFEDVTTMFHEFGHGLHGLFASQTYPTISGTATARDFVEFPSQFNEHWALEPRVLAHYAVNYQTGVPMPGALVAKIKQSEKFNLGYSFGELLAAAQLDMAWHSLPASAGKQEVDAFETKALAATGLDVAHVPPRYRTSYFNHIWASGYSAGYYAYLWTKMLEENVYDWFESNGGMTRANGERFRDLVLSKGHTQDYGVMFRNMVGHDPEVGPLLKSRGFTDVR